MATITMTICDECGDRMDPRATTGVRLTLTIEREGAAGKTLAGEYCGVACALKVFGRAVLR